MSKSARSKSVRAAAFAGVAALSIVYTSPAWALLGVGDVVFDPTAYAQQIEQYAAQLRQAETELSQLEQQVTTYEQMVQNAAHLTSLPQTLSALGVPNLNAEATAFRSISQLYQMGVSGQQFLAQAQQTLSSQGWTLPTLPSMSNFPQLASQFYGPTDATNVTTGYNRQVAETNGYLQSAGAMNTVEQQRETLATSLNDQLAAANASLGDNTEGQTLQAIYAAQTTADRQNDLSLQLQSVSANAGLQQELNRINTEATITQSDLSDTQARAAYRRAPANDFTTLPWTSN
jgi:hypothetical protein